VPLRFPKFLASIAVANSGTVFLELVRKLIYGPCVVQSDGGGAGELQTYFLEDIIVKMTIAAFTETGKHSTFSINIFQHPVALISQSFTYFRL
jgi:hypothetical protein